MGRHGFAERGKPRDGAYWFDPSFSARQPLEDLVRPAEIGEALAEVHGAVLAAASDMRSKTLVVICFVERVHGRSHSADNGSPRGRQPLRFRAHWRRTYSKDDRCRSVSRLYRMKLPDPRMSLSAAGQANARGCGLWVEDRLLTSRDRSTRSRPSMGCHDPVDLHRW